MKVVIPQVYLIASTSINEFGLYQMLQAVGAPNWAPPRRPSDGELLIEVAGRLCYKAFGVDLNKNLTKVREGNHEYIGNILKQKHGSVIEHSTATFAFIGVSRIFTHELCRHRAGTAISQESMRFVRMEEIGMYIPDAIEGDAIADLEGRRLVKAFEEWYQRAVKAFRLDDPTTPFAYKKKITSALRRFAPGGHTTNIIMTANHRAWRHMIEMRTTEGAEEEIRNVLYEVGKQLKNAFPSLYQDMTDPDTSGTFTFLHNKV